jgi:small redox-active disulfide protein 2
VVIKVLGPGCSNCRKLEALVTEAVGQLGIQAEIVKVSEMRDIMAYGVMSTPALVIDEELKLAGRIPSLGQVVDLIVRAG